MGNRYQKALDIVDPGACNPSGIAHALIEAIQEARDDERSPRQDPACQLISYQLASVMGMEPIDWGDRHYWKAVEECRRLAQEARRVNAADPLYQAAEKVFQTYDFEGGEIEVAADWKKTENENEACRALHFFNSDGGDPIKGSFVVRFTDSMFNEVEYAYALIDGAYIGRMPEDDPAPAM